MKLWMWVTLGLVCVIIAYVLLVLSDRRNGR